MPSYKSEEVVDNLLMRFSSTRHPKIVNKKAIQLGGGGEGGREGVGGGGVMVIVISRLPVHFFLYSITLSHLLFG